jgi:hypothetical protein
MARLPPLPIAADVDDAPDDEAGSPLSFEAFNNYLYDLGTTRPEYAAEMRIAERTSRSWRSEGTPIPFYVDATLKLMRRLKDHGLPWRLDDRTPVPPGMPSSKAAATARRRAIRAAAASFIGVDEIVDRLRSDNKALAPWAVDLEGEWAQLGTLKLRFKVRPEGGFIPLSYERSDGEYDADADWPFLVDGFGCIAREMQKQGLRFHPELLLGPPLRRPQGYVLWEQRLAPNLVVTVSDDALRELMPQSLDPIRRMFLDMNRTRLAAHIAQMTDYLLAFGDPTTGLLTIKLNATELRAAKLRPIFPAEPDEPEDLR